MDFVPQTFVYLLTGVPLDNSYKHTMDFNSVTAQEDYFMGKAKKAYQDFTYQRERRAIRVPELYDVVVDCNYVMYKNNNYSGKWFYAFITEVNYLNPNTTEVVIETDVLQTWMFDYQVKPSFIMREHVSNDNMFQHTVPEHLELGPITQGSVQTYDLSSMAIVLAYMPTNLDNDGGRVLDGVYTGAKYLWFGVTSAEVATLNSIIRAFADAGFLDDILAVFMVPAQFVVGGKASVEIQRQFGSIDGYYPKNRKLYCYPFTYFAVNNCRGSENIYRYELFRNPTDFRFNIAYAFNMDSSCNCHPMDYANIQQNWDEGIVLSDFPQCSWVGNVYANWYARNKNSIETKLGQQAVAVVSGIAMSAATMNPGPGISAINNITSTLAQIGDKSLFPYQIQGQASSGVSNVKWGRVGFEFKTYNITYEYAEIIDNFFEQFGYKVNRLGVPDTKSRRYWNYIQTVSCCITGAMPVDHLSRIKQIYDQGVTFWHDSDVGNYARDNAILNPPPAPNWPAPSPAPDPGPPPDPGPGPTPGEWTYPIVNWQANVTSEWGWRTNPITGEEQFHNGIDIGFPVGTGIRAIHAGTVLKVSSSNARGNYVDVQVSSAIFYRYQHCDTILVNEGGTVKEGETIATVGETGQVTGPHLHLEIYLDGNTVNPRNYIPNG